MRRPWAVLLLVAAALLGLQPASATHQTIFDVNAMDLHVLLYHPFPDENGDTWGVPAMTVNGTQVDRMAGYYGGYYFPTAVFDGLMVFEANPEGDTGAGYQETYNNYRAVLGVRRNDSTPLRIVLDGALESDRLVVNATVDPATALDERGLVLHVVLFEDDVLFDGGNGVLRHRFVVRDLHDSVPLDFSQGEAATTEATFAIAAAWQRETLGVVAFVQNTVEDSNVFKFKEVVQSATWSVGQDGPTQQSSKGVLLELYSATWCAACVYADSAADNLANEFGQASALLFDSPYAYLRWTQEWMLGAAVVVGAAAMIILARRAPPERGAS